MTLRLRSLLISLLTVAALTACTRGEIIDKFSGSEGRKPQVVDGPRRMPELNPQIAPVMDAPPAAQMTPPPSGQMTPFDMNHESQADEAAPAPQSSATPDYFGQYMAAERAQNNDALRKPIAENPGVISQASSASAPEVLATLQDPERTVPAFSPMMDDPAPPARDAAQQAAPAPTTHDSPSFFDRLISPFNKQEQAQVTTEESSLSTVPPTPERFTEVQTTRDAQIQNLQMDHAVAQENKQMLDAQPSQLQMEESPAAPVALTPAPEMPMPASAQTSSDEPVLLGRIGDTKKTTSVNMPAPAPVVMEAPPAPVEPAVETQAKPATAPWWKRWNVLDDSSQPESTVAPLAVEEIQAPAPVAQPLLMDTPTQTVPDFKPVGTAAPAYAPPPAPQEPPVETSTETPAPAVSDTKEGLPSPQILKDVKTLPPSRYNSRNRQYYLVP